MHSYLIGHSRFSISDLIQRFAAQAERIPVLESALNQREERLAALHQQLSCSQSRMVQLETELNKERESAAEKLAVLQSAGVELKQAFQALAGEVLKVNSEIFLRVATSTMERFQVQAGSDLEQRRQSVEELVKPLAQSLTAYNQELRAMEQARQDGYARLSQQVESLSAAQANLIGETGKLVKALRLPQVRGRWGEMTLRRVVELAGMSPHCDFVEQRQWGFFMLQEGVDFGTLAMGMFGIGEILINLEKELTTELVTRKITHLWPTLKHCAESKWAILRGSFIGFFIGILPGGGAVISSLVSYAVEKKFSKHPEEFGKGAIRGVAGPESANNSAASASFIPLLTLGIPGNASIAMIFAALLIQGVQPGPFLITEHPDVFWGVGASMYVGNVMLLILNLPMVGMWVQLLRVPYAILAPIIVLFCCIGVYSIRNTVFDIWVMGIFGVIGYFFRKVDMEPGPLRDRPRRHAGHAGTDLDRDPRGAAPP